MSSLKDYDPAGAGLIYIDANIFIHVLLNDPRFGATCKTFLTRVEKGDVEASLSPLDIDEIAYKIIVEKLQAELGLATVGEVLRQFKRDPDRLDSAKPELLAFLFIVPLPHPLLQTKSPLSQRAFLARESANLSLYTNCRGY